jgi:methyl-galactoside transport system substrate-binding protein
MLINKIQQKNIPIIFFLNPEPATMDVFKFYPKAYIIASDSKQAGILQGKIIINEWNSNKAIMDRNQDNKLQYILLKGPQGDKQANDRTEYAISTINNSGIKTQELASQFANWDKDIAKTAITALFLNYGDTVEAIISNNDAMAIGAIEALQRYGYNKGNKSKTIPVVGIDAIPEAKDFIKKGFMAGTVIQDPHEQAQALYTVGMNLINNKNPIEGTKYKLYNNEKIIFIPFKEYTDK